MRKMRNAKPSGKKRLSGTSLKKVKEKRVAEAKREKLGQEGLEAMLEVFVILFAAHKKACAGETDPQKHAAAMRRLASRIKRLVGSSRQ